MSEPTANKPPRSDAIAEVKAPSNGQPRPLNIRSSHCRGWEPRQPGTAMHGRSSDRDTLSYPLRPPLADRRVGQGGDMGLSQVQLEQQAFPALTEAQIA